MDGYELARRLRDGEESIVVRSDLSSLAVDVDRFARTLYLPSAHQPAPRSSMIVAAAPPVAAAAPTA